MSYVKADDGAENVSVIDTCFSRGASQFENSSSGKRALFVALLAKERGIEESDTSGEIRLTRRSEILITGMRE